MVYLLSIGAKNMDLEKYIGVTPDFPKKGISFKDISPLLADSHAFNYAVKKISNIVSQNKPDLIIGPESRGFVIGSPVAFNLGIGFVMARKKGKLPGDVISKTYTLEYNTATIELPKFSIKKGTRVCLIDDLLATGGTLKACKELVEQEGGIVTSIVTLIELKDLDGAKLLDCPNYTSLLKL